MPDAEVETTTDEAILETVPETDAVPNDETETDPVPQPDAEKPAEVDYKAKWEAQRAVSRRLEKELNEARRQIDEQGKTAEEIAEERKQREAVDANLRRANERIIKQGIRLAAKGRLSDPDDALAFIATDEFEVTDDGDYDTEAIEDAITDLLSRKPHLAAQAAVPAPKFQPVDQGATRKGTTPGQLTRDDLKKMTAEQIMAAQKEGRLSKLTAR